MFGLFESKKGRRPIVRTKGLLISLMLTMQVRGYLLTIFGILSHATTNSLLFSSCCVYEIGGKGTDIFKNAKHFRLFLHDLRHFSSFLRIFVPK